MKTKNWDIKCVMDDLVRAYNHKKATFERADQLTGCCFCGDNGVQLLDKGAEELVSMLDVETVTVEGQEDGEFLHKFEYQGVPFCWLSRGKS